PRRRRDLRKAQRRDDPRRRHGPLRLEGRDADARRFRREVAGRGDRDHEPGAPARGATRREGDALRPRDRPGGRRAARRRARRVHPTPASFAGPRRAGPAGGARAGGLPRHRVCRLPRREVRDRTERRGGTRSEAGAGLFRFSAPRHGRPTRGRHRRRRGERAGVPDGAALGSGAQRPVPARRARPDAGERHRAARGRSRRRPRSFRRPRDARSRGAGRVPRLALRRLRMDIKTTRSAFAAALAATGLAAAGLAPLAAAQTHGRLTLVSVDPNGGQTDDGSFRPAVSADGIIVAFESDATNLVPGDTNDQRDIFVRDRATDVTERVSVTWNGMEALGDSQCPAISADGRYVAFLSRAWNMVERGANLGTPRWDVYVHDR